MAKDELMSKIGPWAFIAGLIIAIVSGTVIPNVPAMMLFLGVLGLVVGLMNITDKETKGYLIATIAFLVSASGMNLVIQELKSVITVPLVISVSNGIMSVISNIVVFIAPGAAIVALKAIYALSRD
jgi:ATP synthase protein I